MARRAGGPQDRALYNCACGYVFTAASLSLPERKLLGDRDTRISLRVNNLVNRGYSDPGFGGIDFPAQGVTATLLWVQQL